MTKKQRKEYAQKQQAIRAKICINSKGIPRLSLKIGSSSPIVKADKKAAVPSTKKIRLGLAARRFWKEERRFILFVFVSGTSCAVALMI
jgi:hypothetical protein